jgi:hypothetical protein
MVAFISLMKAFISGVLIASSATGFALMRNSLFG